MMGGYVSASRGQSLVPVAEVTRNELSYCSLLCCGLSQASMDDGRWLKIRWLKIRPAPPSWHAGVERHYR